MNRADPKRACQWIVLGVSEATNDFGLLEYLPCVTDDLLPNRGDVDTAVGPLEKSGTEFFFELVNLPRKCWLTDETALGSLTEVQGFAYCDKVFKVTEVHL